MNSNFEGYEEPNKLAEEILNCIEWYKNKIPIGFGLLDRKKMAGTKDILTFLEILFKEEEKEIEKRRQRAFITLDYENGVREFAVAIVRILWPKHKDLAIYSAYRGLIVQKHVAYALFHLRNGGEILLADTFGGVYNDIYLGLVDFYEGFYGRFHDNEEAIELLCKYFPKVIHVEEYKQKIASALYTHISNAGTPDNIGYAFQGISKIEDYIGCLPGQVVMELLGQYQVRFIAISEVYRHQVYAIIEYSQLEDARKTDYKFRFLDSVILAQRLETHFAQKWKGELPVENFTSMFEREDNITDMITVCKEPSAYWSNGEGKERIFFLDERPTVRIRLKEESHIEIIYIKGGGHKKDLLVPYSYGDWLLESYKTKEMEQELSKLILGTGSHYNQMFFSLLYLDHYRGMENQVIDFDHRFQFERIQKRLRCRKENPYQIENFYGQRVKTLSCIVGKNGMGKSSIIDFLWGSFFKMLRLVEDYGMPCKRGLVKEEDYLEYNILDEGMRFFIVFQLGEEFYFLTNMDHVECEKAKPFKKGIYNSVNEFSKAAYFSNMLKNSQEDIFWEESDSRMSDKQQQEKREIGRSLRGFRQTDYSEKESFIRRRKAMVVALESGGIFERERAGGKGSVNKELCYQLAFLKNMDEKKVCEYLDMDENRMFKISSRMNGWMEDRFFLGDLKNADQWNRLEEKYLFLPDAQIQYFSSGQYVKLAFLAKLYWFLEGYSKETIEDGGKTKEKGFRSEDALLDGETAIIFIDEGETYYHPEWQRRYIKTLLELIEGRKKSYQIQIVITTNSPFLLSDILKEDVIYLAKGSGNNFDNTLAQNIHKLLKDHFFMDYTIGEYARELVDKMVSCLKNPEDGETGQMEAGIKELVLRYYGKEKEAYAAVQFLIEQIGEPVYRYELEKLLNESEAMKEHKRMEWLLEEKRKIEEEINRLEKKGYD